MATTEFDRGTAVEKNGDGLYRGSLDPSWWVQAGPNGGYLAALLLRAVTAEVDDADKPPRSFTVHYQSRPVEGPVDLRVTTNKSGRSLQFLSIDAIQDDVTFARGIAVFGVGRTEVEFQDVAPPEVPAPDALDVPPPIGREMPPIAHRFDYRPVDAGLTPFSGGPGELWCWLRLADPRPIDAAVLALYVDALIPAMFFRSPVPVLVPTVDLTTHFRKPPAEGDDGWVLGHVKTATATGGFVEEDCEMYDTNGALLAQSRQLSIIVPLG